ncbi:uncharacterized protein LOC128986507 [Macrosteles quadrilineatus]|uniref:uncharacterized protein LOC128986507 n=1 Tax=Macrosteles quadrilineatus TaxID=74068 RepID=UPI0023E22A8D|nr:uncharacterized protein LOC128986507 [Macrosteles quadrilineatus]
MQLLVYTTGLSLVLLYPIVHTISQESQENLQEKQVKIRKFDSLRNKLNSNSKFDSLRNKLTKASEYWDLINGLYSADEEKVNEVLDKVVDVLKQIMPECGEIDPIEVDGGIQYYVCGGRGQISDLRSIELIDKSVDDASDGGKILRLQYRYTSLQFTYNAFYIKLLTPQQGKLHIIFANNHMEIEVKIPSKGKLILNSLTSNCCLYVQNFNINTLEFDKTVLGIPQPTLFQLGEQKVSDKVKKDIRNIQRRFENTVLKVMHKRLPASGSYVCKNQYLADELKSRGVNMDSVVVSEKFENTCGKIEN